MWLQHFQPSILLWWRWISVSKQRHDGQAVILWDFSALLVMPSRCYCHRSVIIIDNCSRTQEGRVNNARYAHAQWMFCWMLCIESADMFENKFLTCLYNDVSSCSHFHSLQTRVNTLRPRQHGRHFADDTFKRIFLNENVIISIKISLKFVPKGPINNIPALVQIMAWRLPGDKPLSEAMMVSLLTHICVTRPQWVINGAMMTSEYGNTFRISGPLWGNPSVIDGYPSQSHSDAELWCLDILLNKQSSYRWFETPRRSCDVIVKNKQPPSSLGIF